MKRFKALTTLAWLLLVASAACLVAMSVSSAYGDASGAVALAVSLLALFVFGRI